MLAPYLLAILLALLSISLAWIATRRSSRSLKALAISVAVLTVMFAGLLARLGPVVVTRARVVGTYSDDPANGHEELQLRQDGTYRYTFTPVTGPEFTLSGGWVFDFGINHSEVVLSEFSPKFPGADLGARTWRLSALEDWGMIRLWTSDTARRFYLGAAR